MGKVLTIPKEVTKEGELVIIPRREYEEFLKCSRGAEDQNDRLWRQSSKEKLLKSYHEVDVMYDKIYLSLLGFAYQK